MINEKNQILMNSRLCEINSGYLFLLENIPNLVYTIIDTLQGSVFCEIFECKRNFNQVGYNCQARIAIP